MTTEQREAIDRLNKDKNKPLACGDITIVNISDLDTALSLIKEQRKENELAKEQLKKQCEIVDERNNLLVKVNRLESQIDLMANYIVDLIKYNNPEEKREVEEIKQYFERKSKKMKKKKEIEIQKNKHIYQRYNGIITKYIVDKEYYIAVETGIANRKDTILLLGTVSESIIDLVEIEDIVFTEDFYGYSFIHIYDEEMLEALKEDVKNEVKIKSILTHEQYEQNCCRLEE